MTIVSIAWPYWPVPRGGVVFLVLSDRQLQTIIRRLAIEAVGHSAPTARLKSKFGNRKD
jgi:hypothetical protein